MDLSSCDRQSGFNFPSLFVLSIYYQSIFPYEHVEHMNIFWYTKNWRRKKIINDLLYFGEKQRKTIYFPEDSISVNEYEQNKQISSLELFKYFYNTIQT